MKRNSLIFLVGFLLAASPAFAFDNPLEKAQLFFLQKQYVQAIDECTLVIKANPGNPEVLSQANYLAAVSYVHLFDFLTAKKNFRAVIDTYKGSVYYEDAYLGLGDVEFLQENYKEALKIYEEFLRLDPSQKRRATLYFRLAEIYLKQGREQDYKTYLGKLQQDYPLSFEAKDSLRLQDQDTGFTVQVGAFTNYENADKFISHLKKQGYDVYSVLCMLSGKKLCRIRIGHFKSEEEAEDVKRKLQKDGYFAKVFPLE